MNIENFEFHQKSLEIRKFPESLVPELESNMKSGKAEFVLEHSENKGEEQIKYLLQFRKHSEHDFYYFNRYQAILTRGDEIVAQASIRASWKITAEEAYRILKYEDKVAVHKTDLKNEDGDKFNAYIAADAEKGKDEHGTLSLNTYHDNYYKKYPFDLDNALAKLPVPIKELVPENLVQIKRDLVQAIPVKVTLMQDGSETTGYLTINARIGRIDILDNNMEKLELVRKYPNQEQNNLPENNSQNQSAQEPDQVKKKPWQHQQRVNWNRNKQGKGMSI